MSEIVIQRVERDVILPLRGQVLSSEEARVGAFPGDMATETRHWAALLDGEVVGCVSVMNLRGWALRGMAVAPEQQGAGVGRALVEVVHAEVGAPMWCNAREDAVGFYARMGWTAVGPRFVIQHHGPHQRMTWG
ncbi:MAG: GNAT family N-acetyltransferase [Proteobacteria bacterium]|nr:GNAT family N-acetyltransferase [Pseudomonadota bacterium]